MRIVGTVLCLGLASGCADRALGYGDPAGAADLARHADLGHAGDLATKNGVIVTVVPDTKYGPCLLVIGTDVAQQFCATILVCPFAVNVPPTTFGISLPADWTVAGGDHRSPSQPMCAPAPLATAYGIQAGTGSIAPTGPCALTLTGVTASYYFVPELATFPDGEYPIAGCVPGV